MSKQYYREYKIECRIKIFVQITVNIPESFSEIENKKCSAMTFRTGKVITILDSTYIIITKFNKTDSNAQEFKNPFISVIYCLL